MQRKGSDVVLGLNTAKTKLIALREVILCMSCKDSAAIESSSAYLMRCYKDALACGVSLPSSALAEVARRQVLAALVANNIDDAVRALALDSEYGCINSWTGNESTKTNMQAEIALNSLVFLLARDPSEIHDDADLKELTTKLPQTVKDVVVTCACLHLSRIVSPSPCADAEVLESTACLQDPAKVSDTIAKKVVMGRGKELIASARSFVVQRGIDAGLGAELQSVQSSMSEMSDSPPVRCTEEALVGIICEAKELGKKKVRLQGLLQKMSQAAQVEKSADISFCNKALRSRGVVLGAFQVSAFWVAMQKPLAFISKASQRCQLRPAIPEIQGLGDWVLPRKPPFVLSRCSGAILMARMPPPPPHRP